MLVLESVEVECQCGKCGLWLGVLDHQDECPDYGDHKQEVHLSAFFLDCGQWRTWGDSVRVSRYRELAWRERQLH